MNFCIPSHTTKLSETSIKILGPKIWTDVPAHFKDLQFRKTFSNHFKNHLLGKLPTIKRTKQLSICKKGRKTDPANLYELFFGEDNDSTFYGFETSYTLQEIFDKTVLDDTFYGFEILHA